MKNSRAPEVHPHPRRLLTVSLDGQGRAVVELAPDVIDLVRAIAERLPLGNTSKEDETYDTTSEDLPIGKKRFRQGCREEWWHSWRGTRRRLTARKSDVDAWVQGRATTPTNKPSPAENRAEDLLAKAGLTKRTR